MSLNHDLCGDGGEVGRKRREKSREATLANGIPADEVWRGEEEEEDEEERKE